jgi:hypothetical protein
MLTLLKPMVLPPCYNAPSINSVTKASEQIRTCMSGGWQVVWQVNISGALQSGQEYYWEHATDSAGTSWSFWGRGTSNQKTRNDGTIGSNDGGYGTSTVYHRARVSVVPVGESPPNNCDVGSNEPVAAVAVEDHTDFNCFE